MENFFHLLRRLQIIIVSMITHPVFIRNHGTRTDANKRVMSRRIRLMDVMTIIGSDEFQTKFLGQLRIMFMKLLLSIDVVIHKFKIKLLRAKNFDPFANGPSRFIQTVIPSVIRNLSFETSGKRD